MKTRTKGTIKTVAEATKSAKTVAPRIQLPPESTNPPHLFILPEDASPEARIVSIENPRYEEDNRYLVCPERGIYEFTRVAPPKITPRSWLLQPHQDGDAGKDEQSDGFVTNAAELYLATPIDPMFILLPALAPKPKSNSLEPVKKLFLSGDDYLETVTTLSPDLSGLIRIEALRTRLENRMAVVCDTVDAGHEVMYRLSYEKLLEELLKKARSMVAMGLPISMEEKFVRKALEIPMLSMKRDTSSLSELVNEEDPVRADAANTTGAETPDTQNSTSTGATSFSEISSAPSSFSEDTEMPFMSVPPIDAPEGIANLLRLRTALFFIFTAYLAPHLSEVLKILLSSSSSLIDFAPLDTHLAHLAKLRLEAVTARSIGDYSRKRSINDDEEGLESRAEKKRKKDEEEKRKKAGQSRGVRDLKKVNVSGMMKMSDFFKKKS